jgi:hypothetical protein
VSHSFRRPAALAAFLLLASSPAFAEDIVLYAARAPVVAGAWRVVNDSSAAGGARLEHPDLGTPKLASAQRQPANYFELGFTAAAGVPYRLWLRGRAAGNSFTNDSVFVQFSDGVNASGAPVDRIDTTSAHYISIGNCSGCGLAGWGWQDSGYGAGVLGPAIRFASSGVHRIRIQGREDGISIDQIVLSSTTWLNGPPGTTKNDNTLLPTTEDPPAVTTLRPPFLQQLRAGSATVVWGTREGGAAAVRYRRAGSASWSTQPATSEMVSSATTGLPYAFVQHEARLTGLAPQTEYAYDVSVRGVILTEGSFRTAPPTGAGQVRFVAFGDSGTGSVEQRKLAVRLASEQPDLLLHTGDVAYQSGSLKELTDRFFGIYGGWLAGRGVAPSIGNHDDVTFEAAAYLNSFVLPLNAPAGVQERYYSFDFGPAHFVALDTQHAFLDPALRAEQLSWLRADLAATTQPWKIVFFHRPPFDSGPHHPAMLDVRQAFGPVFEELGVQLVLSGHEHIYERTVPWQAFDGPGAPVYIVTGGGGGPIHQTGRSAFTAATRAVNHFVRGSIIGDTLTLTAVDATGAVFDTYVLNRTLQADDAAAPHVSFTAPAAGASVSGLVHQHRGVRRHEG